MDKFIELYRCCQSLGVSIHQNLGNKSWGLQNILDSRGNNSTGGFQTQNNLDKINNMVKNVNDNSVNGCCSGTEFGCCPDGKTSKMNLYGTNCAKTQFTCYPDLYKGCGDSQFGCCPDGITPRSDSYGSNCTSKFNNKPKEIDNKRNIIRI